MTKHYNGFTPNERAAKSRALAKLRNKGFSPCSGRCCDLCGDPDSPNFPHSEDYAQPYEWEPPYMYALCRACHGWIHKRFNYPFDWIAFKNHIRRGGYGFEFTSSKTLAERKKFKGVYEQGLPFHWEITRSRNNIISGWWEHLTLDPNSLTNPIYRGRPSFPIEVSTMQNALFTVDNYITALMKLRDDKLLRNTKYLELLRAQYNAPKHTISAPQLAKIAGYSDHGVANLHYGKMAHHIAITIDFTPEARKNGEPMWWQALSTGSQAQPKSPDDQFEWVMRPELIAALKKMNWT